MFQSRCQDSMGCDKNISLISTGIKGFSPVARIQWVATEILVSAGAEDQKFQSRCQDSMGCDFQALAQSTKRQICFSPVARIQWVATAQTHCRDGSRRLFQSRCQDSMGCDHPDRFAKFGTSLRFSPVARIQWVATTILGHAKNFKSLVSVPLPGFNGLRPLFMAFSTCLL